MRRIIGLLLCMGFVVCYFVFRTRENTLILKEESPQQEAVSQQESKYPEEEQQFLKEHLYGQWRFARQIVKMDEEHNYYYGSVSTISDVGAEELKQAVVLAYGEDAVWFPIEIKQDSFSNAQDMFLFAARGGFSWTRKPLYKMEPLDTDKIILRDIYSWEGYEVQMPGWEAYIHVKYDTSDTQEARHYYGRNIYTPFGSDIYVNPEDTDTIYIDFCGLWEMKRNDAEEPDYTEEEPEYLLSEKPGPLSEEEQQFLREHLYGQWRFADRIVKIEENGQDRQGVTPNISDVGVDELKKGTVLLYEETSVEFIVKIWPDSFSSAQDMFLFASNGGIAVTSEPLYKMEPLDTDKIILKDVYAPQGGCEVQLPEWEGYVHVSYYVPDAQESIHCGNRIYSLFGSDIYVNPEDTDTIYIDFCGLWEMKRDDTNYGTNGKYYGPG